MGFGSRGFSSWDRLPNLAGMILPRWTWRILRHPRIRAAVLWGIPVLLVLAALGFALANLAGRQRHADFVKQLAARSVAVTVEDAFGPEVPDERNLFAHPALEALRRAGGRTLAGDSRLSWSGGGLSNYGDTPGPVTFGRQRAAVFQWRFASAPGTVHTRSSPTEAEKLAQIVADWPELDGLAEALRRPLAVRLSRTRAGDAILEYHELVQATMALGSRGTYHARLGNTPAAADDANALLDGARTLLHANLPLNDKILARATVTSAARIIWHGSWQGAWTESQLAGFEQRLAAIDPHAAMISGLRHSLSLAAATGANARPRTFSPRPGASFHDSVANAWRAFDRTPGATWPDRAAAVWYYHRPVGFWLGDLARRCETVDAWTMGRTRFTADDWKILRPHLAEIEYKSGFRPERALPLAHVALAAAHALDLETELAFARLAVDKDRERIKNGRYIGSSFWADPALAEKLLTDPWSGGKLTCVHSRVHGEGVEFRSVGPDGIPSLKVSPWGDFSDGGDRSWHCGYDRSPRPLPKFPVRAEDPNR
jgi:hypothetical protein